MASSAGSSNYTFSTPIAHYPGRGRLPLALDLVYNSRLWQSSGTTPLTMIFDIDGDWPAPGWSLHFGKIVRVGEEEIMIVEPDGRRRPFKKDGTDKQGDRQYFYAHTIDGTSIVYSAVSAKKDPAKLATGHLVRSDGTEVEFAAKSPDGDTVFATRITDVNGNTIRISYVDGLGPEIDSVTDTCGRKIQFHYYQKVLTHVTGPGFDPSQKETELIRIQFTHMEVQTSFTGKVLGEHLGASPVITGIYYPATHTGFDFSSPGDYSTYGMLRRVRKCRGMSIAGPNHPNEGALLRGDVSSLTEYAYPDGGGASYQEEGTACSVYPAPGPDLVPLYRLYSSGTGDHFYTISLPERDMAVASGGYVYDFEAAQVFAASGAGRIPLLRLVNSVSGDHFYTTSMKERDDAVASGAYAEEGIACYVPDSAIPGTVPFFRMRSLDNGDHCYTLSAQERDSNVFLTGAPTYRQMTETWAGQDGGQAVTRFGISTSGAATRTTIVWPDGSWTVEDAKNGLLDRLDVFDSDGRRLQQNLAYWRIKTSDGTPQLLEVQTIGGADNLVKTTYAYNDQASEPYMVDRWEYAHANQVLVRTVTDYVTDQKYLDRNLLNLPSSIKVIDGFAPNGPYTLTAASFTEYTYDETDLSPTPDVVGLDDKYQPNNPRYTPTSLVRGNPTTIRRYTNAAAETGVIVEKRAYDLCGNQLTSDIGRGRKQWLYRPEAQYMAHSAIRLAASDPNDDTFVEVQATTYYRSGQPLSVTNANDEKTNVFFDNAGRPTSLELANGSKWNFTYDDVAMTVTATNGNSLQRFEQVTHLNGRNQITKVRTRCLSGWDVTEYSYDWRGRMTTSSIPRREGSAADTVSVKMTYDALGRPSMRSDPAGGATSWHYDEKSRPDIAGPLGGFRAGASTVRVTDPAGGERWIMIDALGRLKQIVVPEPDGDGKVFPAGGACMDYSYDTLGNVTSISLQSSNGSVQQRRFEYDALGRLQLAYMPEFGDGYQTGTPGADGWSFAYQYDDRSNMTQRTDARGITTVWDYADPLDRLQTIRYDLSKFSDAAHPVIPCPEVSYGYVREGDLRRVETETVKGISQQSFHYKPFGLYSKTTTLDGVEDFPFTVDYLFDELDRPTGIDYPNAYGNGATTRPRAEIPLGLSDLPLHLKVDGILQASELAYGPGGRLEFIKSGASGNEADVNYIYYPFGPLERQKIDQGATTLLNLHYEYHLAAFGSGLELMRRIHLVKDQAGPAGSRAYRNDKLGRTITAAGGEEPHWGWVEDYAYDARGNRTSVTAKGELDAGTAAPTDGVASLAYDSANRISTNGFDYDAAGNLTAAIIGGSSFRYQYDVAGRLAMVTNADTGELTEYVYGACPRRRARLTLKPGTTVGTGARSLPSDLAASESATFYVWDGDSVIAEYEDQGPDLGKSAVWKNYFMYMASMLISRRENLGAGSERTLFEFPGPTGTRYVTGPGTQEDHEPLPYGGAMVNEGDAARTFTTYERDHQTGLDYAVNRFYHPQLGRFLQPDPIAMGSFRSTSSQSLNLYAYCDDDPVNNTDPLGLAPIRVVEVCTVSTDGLVTTYTCSYAMFYPIYAVAGPLGAGPSIDADAAARGAGGGGHEGHGDGGPAGGPGQKFTDTLQKKMLEPLGAYVGLKIGTSIAARLAGAEAGAEAGALLGSVTVDPAISVLAGIIGAAAGVAAPDATIALVESIRDSFHDNRPAPKLTPQQEAKWGGRY